MAVFTLRSGGRFAPSQKGFTLVELLVVIAIIGILIAMLLPAIQAAREAARKLECKNKLKQLSIGFHHALELQGVFPAHGWSVAWGPDPDLGFGIQQPGGWGYQILPFIEQQPLFELGKGGNMTQKQISNMTRYTTPISVWNCPTRRAAQTYPINAETASSVGTVETPLMCRKLKESIRSCYVVNAGDCRFFPPNDDEPGAIFGGPNWKGEPSKILQKYMEYDWDHFISEHTGVVYTHSQISASDIPDGLSNTYLIGEKYSRPDKLDEGGDWGDDEAPYTGADADGARWGCYPPMQDTPGVEAWRSFGSPHSGSFNMGFCDGSVRSIPFDVDLEVHAYLSNRFDGVATEMP